MCAFFVLICDQILRPKKERAKHRINFLNPLKKLAGQTAIYGLGTLVPRLLNYLLVPLYTRLLLKDEYGMVTELYAYIAFFFVILLYGMETTFFRFAEKEKDPQKVFSTALISILFTSSLFLLLVIIFISPITSFLEYPGKYYLILMAGAIVAIDAFSSIQFAHLRQQNKSIQFSIFKIITVLVNVGLNLYFILFCESVYKTNPDSPWILFYNPEFSVGYVLISNLIASLVGIFLLLPQLINLKWFFDRKLLKQMLVYTFPLLIVGISGMVNEVLDKIMFKYLAPVPEGIRDASSYVMSELGIYGANFKLAVLMTLFIQMFRYAAEPFFFAQARESNAKQVYADVMKYFVIFCLFIFLLVMLFLDIFKYFIGPGHWGGLYIVPLVLLANLFLGIFFNLSIWYKINDLTKYGAVIAIIGSIITIVMNLVLVPRFSYLGAAWARFTCYFVMMVLSYLWGRKIYPITYDLKKILFYIAVALILFALSYYVIPEQWNYQLGINAFLFLIFLVTVFIKEKALFFKSASRY